MKKLIIIVLAILLSTGMAFAANQKGKGTSGDQGIGHSGPGNKGGNQGNDKRVGNAGGKSTGNTGGDVDVGCGSCGEGPDNGGTVSRSPGMVSLGGGISGGTIGNRGYDSNRSNMSDRDPQIEYGAFMEPNCSLIDWFSNDFSCP